VLAAIELSSIVAFGVQLRDTTGMDVIEEMVTLLKKMKKGKNG
jgi:hypothetical protein